MMLLSKGATEKNLSLKTQMILPTTNQGEKATKAIWQKNGYFGDKKPDFNISKIKENSLRRHLCMRIVLCILFRIIF